MALTGFRNSGQAAEVRARWPADLGLLLPLWPPHSALGQLLPGPGPRVQGEQLHPAQGRGLGPAGPGRGKTATLLRAERPVLQEGGGAGGGRGGGARLPARVPRGGLGGLLPGGGAGEQELRRLLAAGAVR